MCYRTDLFKAAGLPTDRDAGLRALAHLGRLHRHRQEVPSRASATARCIRRLGDQHVQLDPDAVRRPHLLRHGRQPGHRLQPGRQGCLGHHDQDGRRRPLRQTQVLHHAWNAGFKNGTFATIACPAWMTGYIKEQAGDANSGKWDIASVPGGGGNWGGSFLAVPTASNHQDVAIELAVFLTSAEGSGRLQGGRQPAVQPHALRRPRSSRATPTYFSNAPVGEIFVKGAASLKPVYLGPKNQAVRDAIENDLRASSRASCPAPMPGTRQCPTPRQPRADPSCADGSGGQPPCTPGPIGTPPPPPDCQEAT